MNRSDFWFLVHLRLCNCISHNIYSFLKCFLAIVTIVAVSNILTKLQELATDNLNVDKRVVCDNNSWDSIDIHQKLFLMQEKSIELQKNIEHSLTSAKIN